MPIADLVELLGKLGTQTAEAVVQTAAKKNDAVFRIETGDEGVVSIVDDTRRRGAGGGSRPTRSHSFAKRFMTPQPKPGEAGLCRTAADCHRADLGDRRCHDRGRRRSSSRGRGSAADDSRGGGRWHSRRLRRPRLRLRPRAQSPFSLCASRRLTRSMISRSPRRSTSASRSTRGWRRLPINGCSRIGSSASAATISAASGSTSRSRSSR